MRLFFALAMLSASLAVAEEKPVEIPLKSIWANGIPGTQDINALADGHAQKSLVEPVLKHLQDTWKSEIGRAVQGEGLEALQQFYISELGYGGRKPAPPGVPEIKQNRVYSDGPVSLVFFTQLSGYYVHLQRVERKGGQFFIHYQFVPHKTKELTQQLALIPLGKLPAGMYGTTIVRAPMDEKYLAAGFKEPPPEQSKQVCGSFGFEVLDREAAAAAAKPMSVPLKEIWAHRMPGTQNINELDGGKAQKALVEPLLKNIRKTWNNDHGAAVQGEGLEALQHFYRIEMEGQNKDVLSADAPVSLVFYTRPTGAYVHFQSIEKKGERITIRYRLAPHRTANSPQHLALIPLGKIHPGKYVVKMERLPMEKKYAEIGFSEPSREQESNICNSFTFIVEESKSAEIPDTGDEIALDKIWALQMPGTRDVRELGDDATRIRVRLTERTADRAKAGPCFFVKGEGKVALANAAKVLVDGESPLDKVPAGEDVTLVFYAYSAPGYVLVRSVRRSSEHATVKYQVVTHDTSNATVHFALIPFGRLSPGNFTANLVEVPGDGPEQYPEVKERAICDSCSFVVQDGGTSR